MADPAIGHQNQRVVVGAKGQPDVLLERSVAAHEKKIGSGMRKDLAAKAFALERPTRHRHDAPFARGSLAQILNGMKIEGDVEQMTRLQFFHERDVSARVYSLTRKDALAIV